MEELLLIGCHIGPELKIYRHRIEAEGDDIFEALDRGLLPPLMPDDSFERVVLSVDEESQCGRHFSKLLTGTAWSALELAHAAESEASSKHSSDTSDDDTDSSDSDSGDSGNGKPSKENKHKKWELLFWFH